MSTSKRKIFLFIPTRHISFPCRANCSPWPLDCLSGTYQDDYYGAEKARTQGSDLCSVMGHLCMFPIRGRLKGRSWESWLRDSDRPYSSKNEINKDPHKDLSMEKNSEK